MHPSTVAVTAGRPSAVGTPLNQPIVLASNFHGSDGTYVRTHGTPTWEAFEVAIGALEGGRSVSFSSGMAAASALLSALSPGVVVVPTSSYMGVRSLLGELAGRGALDVRLVDLTDESAVVDAMSGADVLWVETPANPTLEVADVASLCAAAARHGVRVVVDATFATPALAQPLADGALAVLHSGTKAIGGHSDLMIGVVSTTDDGLFDGLRQARLLHGAVPGALEAFLALRGLRTLHLRVERQQASAADLAERLAAHPRVERVRYPGFGTMVSFDVRGGAPAADAVCAATRLVIEATSLGGVESSMERRQKYAGDAHVPPGLVRLSVGIEHIDDLWADLAQALDAPA